MTPTMIVRAVPARWKPSRAVMPKIIHRSVNRIHDPAIFGIHVAGNAFFACALGFPGKPGATVDQLLALHIQFQLDVVRLGRTDAFGFVPVGVYAFFQRRARLSRRRPGGLNDTVFIKISADDFRCELPELFGFGCRVFPPPGNFSRPLQWRATGRRPQATAVR